MTAIVDRRENGIRTRHRPAVPGAPFIPDLERGVGGGVATLDESTVLVPASQLATGSAAAGKALMGDRTWGDVATQPEIDAETAARIAADALLQPLSGKNAPSGYAGLDAGSKLTGSQQVYGTAANTACQGNDGRLSDARTPTAHAASHAAGGSDPLVTEAAWTPTDASGAALAFTGVSGSYEKDGRQVAGRCALTFPATGSVAPTAIALPVAANGAGGGNGIAVIGACNLTTAVRAYFVTANAVALLDSAGGAITNAMMSGKFVELLVNYRT